MKVIDDLLSRACPAPLFHYTTQSGLLGIIGSGEIWATVSRYLNDTSEFTLAQEIARRVLSGRKATSQSSKESKLLSDLELAVENAGTNVCVCSFSENGDSLSQWRGYSRGGIGYAIGFNPELLRAIATKQAYILAPCIYDDRKQFELMNGIVQENLDKNMRLLVDGKYDEEIPGGDFAYHLNRYALVFKNIAFKDEVEWRLISSPKMYSTKSVAFREGTSTIVPYDRLKLAEVDESLPISNVVIGPTPSAIEANQAVRGLLIARRRDHKPVRVGNSIIPFRHW